MTEKRFINDIDDGQLIDTKGELSTIDYSDTVDFYELWEFLNKLADENEQLKQQITHLTMYKNLFREFQKQLDGVKKKSDLDHKDFEDLIELTKGHVFDDEHGWIWLPVNDR